MNIDRSLEFSLLILIFFIGDEIFKWLLRILFEILCGSDRCIRDKIKAAKMIYKGKETDSDQNRSRDEKARRNRAVSPFIAEVIAYEKYNAEQERDGTFEQEQE